MLPGLFAGTMLIAAMSAGCGRAAPAAPENPGPAPSSIARGTSAPSEPKEPPGKSWETTLVEAKREGRVTLYTSLGSETRSDLIKAFKDRYGINVEFVTGTPADLTAKLVRERQSRLYLGDLIIGGAGLTIPMKPYDMLDALDPVLVLPEVTDPKVWRVGSVPIIDKDRQVLVFISTFIRYVVRNTDLIKDGEIKSYADLLAPQYKGKIVLQDPTMGGNAQTFITTLSVLWGKDKAKEYLQSLVKQEPMLTRDLRLQVEWVARGKYPLALAARIETVADFMKEGSPLAPVKVAEGGHLSGGGGGLSVLKDRPDPAATVLFANWLLSKEGQTVFIKGFGNPSARVDVSTEGFSPLSFAGPDEEFVQQNEEFVLLQVEMGKAAAEIFQPLLK